MTKNSTTSNMIVGLDIGTTKIATVVGYRNENGQIEVAGYGESPSTGVEYGHIRNIDHTVNGIKLSVEMASQRSHQEISEVYVGIAGHHVKTSSYKHHLFRHGNNEPISQAEIEQLKEDVGSVTVPAGEEIIDVIPQHYLIDNQYESSDPVGEMGNEVIGTYQLITGKLTEINKVRMCCDRSELKPNDIILEPLASGIACLSEEEKKNGVALLDIGGGTSDLIIFNDGKPVYTKVIAIGGNVITKDIATVCKIPQELAENIKIKYGTCIVEKSDASNYITIPKPHGQEPIQINENYLAQIIYCRVKEEIINTVQREIENSGYGKKLYSGLVLTGGGAQLRNIQELCAFTLGLPTRIGIPVYGFSKTLTNDLKKPKFATALGLLKYGIEDNDCDFIPQQNEENEKKGGRKRTGNNERLGNLKQLGSWVRNILDNIS